MNNRGQLVLVGIMMSFLVFIMLVSLLEAVKDQSDQARTNLSCDDGNLTAMQEATCIVTDSYLFGFFGTAVAVAIGWIGLKRVGGVGE